MKIRSDFVTNSSSSSFIVAFQNKEDYDKQRENMLKIYSSDVVFSVFNAIDNNLMTYTQARKYYEEELKWIARYDICYHMWEYRNKSYEWRESAEYKKLEKEYIRDALEDFDKTVKHRGKFAVISYGDHDTFGSEMEHNIVPNLPFVYRSISHH